MSMNSFFKNKENIPKKEFYQMLQNKGNTNNSSDVTVIGDFSFEVEIIHYITLPAGLKVAVSRSDDVSGFFRLT
jgi:hypothetical protein